MEGEKKTYLPVEDGWKNAVRPCFVEVTDDRFNEGSLVVELSFGMGDGYERPKATIPLVYGPNHKVAVWNNSVKTEHEATAKDQREAYALLVRLFPKWGEYCTGEHTTEEKLYWFEDEGRDEVLATAMDIKVGHTTSGFCYARVKDPANAKPKKERTTKAAALTRAAAAFAQVFGGANEAVTAGTPAADDEGIPF